MGRLGFFSMVCLSMPVALAGVPERPELAAHQGAWKAWSMTDDGRAQPAEVLRDLTRVVKGDVVTRTRGAETGKSRIKLDPSKNPHQMNGEILEGPGLAKGQTLQILGIYRFDDADTLTICTSAPGSKDRPRTFTSAPGSGTRLEVWKRVAR